jgi:peptide/nickel transport system permease protein
VSLLAFGLVHLGPGSPAETIVGNGDPEAVAQVEAQLELDRPLGEQYVDWLRGAVRGDFGEALVADRGEEVSTLLGERLPATLALAIGALVVSTILGIAVGIVAGLHPGSRLDRAIAVVGSVWLALPNFLIAMFAAWLVGARLGWFPVTGLPPLTEDPLGWLHALVLPVLALSLAPAAITARQMRGALADVLQQDYVRTALASGVPRGRIVWRHAMKNALVPVVTVIGFQAATLIGGTVLAEQVFAISGLGQLGVAAVLDHDYPVVQGFIMVAALAVVVGNLIVDVVHGWLDPKVRVR